MKNRTSVACKTASALLLALMLASCGSESPESQIASAKEYLTKSDAKAAIIQLKNALQSKPDLAEGRFLLGKALLEEGNVAVAEIELRKAAELKYPADEIVPLQARATLLLGQPNKVTDQYAATKLATAEANADLQTTIGRAYLAQLKLDAAKTAFESALTAVPGYSQAIFGMARLKAANRDYAGAIALIDDAVAKNPKFFEARQLKGDILTVQGDLQGATEAYRKILELRADYIPAHMALVSAQFNNNNLDEAAKQVEAMKKAAPNNPQTSYLQAELYYRQKKFKEGREIIQQHLRAVPESVPGQQLAGAIEFELKSYATAEKYLLSALPKTPELGVPRRLLIGTYLRTGQPDKALGLLQPVLDKLEGNSDMLAMAGEVYMQNGDAEKAGVYFGKAAALDPENKGKQTAVAVTHLAKGETETAYRELEQIASNDTGIRADLTLIASQLRNRKFDDALKSIATLEKKQPDNPLVYNLRGNALLGKGGDIAGARRAFEMALQKNAAYYPAASSLARLDMGDRKPEEARKRFEGVIAKDGKNTQAMLALAELTARTGGKPEAVEAMIAKAVAANPTDVSSRLALINFHLGAKEAKKAVGAAQDALGALPNNTALLDAEGRAQLAAENYNQALAVYGKLATLVPNAVGPYMRMAEVHMATKDRDAAMQVLRKALAMAPDSIDVQRGIMMLDLDAGRMTAAIETARNLQKQHPKNLAGYLLEGDAYAVNKQWKEAANAYRNGIRQTGSNELAVKLHAVMAEQNIPGEADKFAEAWLKDHPKDHRFRLYIAESATARKDYALATKHYRTLVDFQPDSAAMLNNLAWVLGLAKDPKAIEFAEKAYKLAPDQPSIADTFGALLVEKGDVTRGLDILRKANADAPNNPAIRLNLAKALIKAGKDSEAKKELDELSKLGDRFPGAAEVKDLQQGAKR